MDSFLSSDEVGLKVCGVTSPEDAWQLAEMGVEALGVNFWPQSKRFCSVEDAFFLKHLEGQIVRVGVFVNAEREEPERLLSEGIIDYAQFHGDEDAEYCGYFAQRGLPYIRAIGVKDEDSVTALELSECSALLLDAHAPGVYGGTGQTCDWTIVEKVQERYPTVPIVLAGGITVGNVAQARLLKHIVALDVASGAEKSPGVKDFDKVARLMG